MRTAGKVALVAAGFAGALLVAIGTLAFYIACTNTPDRQASAGMYGFGDSLLFLAVLALASIPATGAALIFLRSHRAFWRTLAIGALAFAATGIAALITYATGRTAPSGTALGNWANLSILRLLVAPIAAGASFLSALLAPERRDRIPLFAASLMDAGAFAGVVLIWWSLS